MPAAPGPAFESRQGGSHGGRAFRTGRLRRGLSPARTGLRTGLRVSTYTLDTCTLDSSAQRRDLRPAV